MLEIFEKIMYNQQKVIVVMPAYNAESTLEVTCAETLGQPFVDRIIIVDDCSRDRTAAVAEQLKKQYGQEKIGVVRIERNTGYGGNQKVCYRQALADGADIVVMVHPDYQYTPLLLPAMISLLGNGVFDCVLGSRILGGQSLRGGMPLYKYIGNRFLTLAENIFTGAKLSEYHTGYRGFTRHLLETLELDGNSDDFVFDNEMLGQILWTGTVIGEVSCPTKYFPEASSINFIRSVRYGFGCLAVTIKFFLARHRLLRSRLFPPDRRNFLRS